VIKVFSASIHIQRQLLLRNLHHFTGYFNMCTSCGCHHSHDHDHAISPDNKNIVVEVLTGLLAENDQQAAHNREHFNQHRVLALNLMSAPGAGKTSLLEATIAALGAAYRIAVIEGDLETENDAQRIRAHGVPAIQITTGGACHLDAQQIHTALHQLNLDEIDILFIENVGNLVCPASFDLGQHHNVTLLSVPEGDDKPAKYPVMFRVADLVLCTKIDLLPLLPEFQPERAERYLRDLASTAPFMLISTRPDGVLTPWLDWVQTLLAARQAADFTA
jgi:hydrogenase nickel incorporation protein HypB